MPFEIFACICLGNLAKSLPLIPPAISSRTLLEIAAGIQSSRDIFKDSFRIQAVKSLYEFALCID